MPKRVTVHRVENETGRPLRLRWRNKDLAGYTVEGILRHQGCGVPITRAATIEDDGPDPESVVRFDFQAGDLIKGEHEFEWKFTDGSANILREPLLYPVIIQVRAKLA
jgi:hypothetical protein